MTFPIVSIHERMPGPHDLSDAGAISPSCWWRCYRLGLPEWHLLPPQTMEQCHWNGYTHWAPHHAIPAELP